MGRRLHADEGEPLLDGVRRTSRAVPAAPAPAVLARPDHHRRRRQQGCREVPPAPRRRHGAGRGDHAERRRHRRGRDDRARAAGRSQCRDDPRGGPQQSLSNRPPAAGCSPHGFDRPGRRYLMDEESALECARRNSSSGADRPQEGHVMTQLASMGGDTSADYEGAGGGETVAPEPYTLSDAPGPLSHDELASVDAWWRAANYLAVGQIYLKDNPL